jgi:hypothetical protein
MLYVSDFASRMTGTGREAALLAQRFRLACRRLGLRTGEAALAELDHSRFAVPAVPGAQLALL